MTHENCAVTYWSRVIYSTVARNSACNKVWLVNTVAASQDVTHVSPPLSGVHALVKRQLDELLAASVLHERDERAHFARSLRLRDDVGGVDEGLDLLVPIFRRHRIKNDAANVYACREHGIATIYTHTCTYM